MTRFALAALGTVLCLAPAYAQTLAARKQTVAYLRALQTKEGGFLPGRQDPNASRAVLPSLRATSAAMRALKYFGGEVPDREACARFVSACLDKGSGGYADRPGGKVDVLTTAIGVMAAVELKLPAETHQKPAAKYLSANAKDFADIRIAAAAFESLQTLPPRAREWLAEVNSLWCADGTAGKGDGVARETGSVAVTVLRLGGALGGERELVIKALREGQRRSGGFGKEGSELSDLESTYRVMRAFMMLKAQPEEVEGVRTFIAKCRNDDAGYGVRPAEPSSVAGTYYAAIITHWLGKDE